MLKPYKIAILESSLSVENKALMIRKLIQLEQEKDDGRSYAKLRAWVDTFLRLPFDKYIHLPVNIDRDGVEKCHDFMENAYATLHTAVYGLSEAKMQIMQMIGQLMTNPQSVGCAIAISGPPGTGKTNLVKEGISRILNRPFAFIPLGGATDSSFLEGHEYTYEGSMCGRIAQILVECQCMNPVIYFDELDKISETPRGEEIVGVLTHLTDTTQNSLFQDKYFAEVKLDLSKCLFIFSYNDESKVNRILKDRMYQIKTEEYSAQDKIRIATDYLLPKLREQLKMTEEQVVFAPGVMQYIIQNFCSGESGVRNLKRCLETILTKLNLYRLMKEDSKLFEQEIPIGNGAGVASRNAKKDREEGSGETTEVPKRIRFPFTVTPREVQVLLKQNAGSDVWKAMYC